MVIKVEFLPIGDSKLKIIMTASEMAKHKLGAGVSLDQTSRRSFWRVLDKAKTATGFDPSGDKVLIQLYPLKEGGCEVFVTKLGLLPDASARAVADSDRVTLLSRRQSCYAFDSLDSLIGVSRAIAARSSEELPEGDIYASSGKYFLILDEYAKGGETSEYPFITEFGKGLTADMAMFISEHSVKLLDGEGIAILSKL